MATYQTRTVLRLLLAVAHLDEADLELVEGTLFAFAIKKRFMIGKQNIGFGSIWPCSDYVLGTGMQPEAHVHTRSTASETAPLGGVI